MKRYASLLLFVFISLFVFGCTDNQSAPKPEPEIVKRITVNTIFADESHKTITTRRDIALGTNLSLDAYMTITPTDTYIIGIFVDGLETKAKASQLISFDGSFEKLNILRCSKTNIDQFDLFDKLQGDYYNYAGDKLSYNNGLFTWEYTLPDNSKINCMASGFVANEEFSPYCNEVILQDKNTGITKTYSDIYFEIELCDFYPLFLDEYQDYGVLPTLTQNTFMPGGSYFYDLINDFYGQTVIQSGVFYSRYLSYTTQNNVTLDYDL